MSPCNTYNRSFAIYLLIVILTPKSPVSGFTLGIERTTTLKSGDADFAAEESALVEDKRDLSKLDNERDYAKFGTRTSIIRNSGNVLEVDKKFVSGVPKTFDQSTTVKFSIENDDVTDTSDNKMIEKQKEIIESTYNDAVTQSLNEEAAISSNVTETLGKSENVTDDDYSPKSTDSYDTSEKYTPDFRFTTTDKPPDTPTVHAENYKDYTTETETAKEDFTIDQFIKKLTTPRTGTANFQTDYTTLKDGENDSIATDSTALTESMVAEFSRTTSQDPSWKKYTVIERKRTNPTTEADSLTPETLEELAKAESVSLKVTAESTDNTPQENQELLSQTTTADIEFSLSTLPAFNNVPETGTEQLPPTQSVSTETTTEVKNRESLASIRAGYLDLSAKQETEESVTTEQLENVKFNETEITGLMFDNDLQENEGPELKNSTIMESQSQLADDAIKEELMKEAMMSDHEENSKRYSKEQDLNKVKPVDANSDESLSVKPIGNGAIYNSRSNYKPMKKIDVQPLKPFLRDPDDNSWRNESLSNLGIVFKAKNASKPFTQVLKNKTEAELNNWSEKEHKNEVPDLRERLEKITEVRKLKKKKLNQFGEMVYSDYEAENSGERSSSPKPDVVSLPVMDENQIFFGNPPTSSAQTETTSQRATTPGVYMYMKETVPTTKKPKKYMEYYDTTDEEDADYLSLSKIDLKKFTTRLFGKETMTTAPPMTAFTKPMTTMLPERKPTVQYFPPRREPQKVNVNDYDTDFQRKVNIFAYSETPKSTKTVPPTYPPATMAYKTTQYLKETGATPSAAQYKPGNLAKNVYDTFPPRVVDHRNRYPASNDESFNRASYIIKHFKDLIEEAAKDDYDKSAEFMPYTEPPLMGGTVKDKDPLKTQMDDDYDYDSNIRKDILNRFVDNFNQNSERFKVDFPILYNSSVVHMQADDGGRVVASSSAFLKRQYGAAQAGARPCCDLKVELSPAYELQYYVPEQEEKEEAEKPNPMPFSYRL